MALTISQSLFFKALTAYKIILKNNIFNVMINKRGVNVMVNILDIKLCMVYDIISYFTHFFQLSISRLDEDMQML